MSSLICCKNPGEVYCTPKCPIPDWILRYFKATGKFPKDIEHSIEDATLIIKKDGDLNKALLVVYLAEQIFLDGNINKDRRIVEFKREVYIEKGDLESKNNMDKILKHLDEIDKLSKNTLFNSYIELDSHIINPNTDINYVNAKKDIFIDLGNVELAKIALDINRSNKEIDIISRRAVSGDKLILKDTLEEVLSDNKDIVIPASQYIEP